jgi:hypothetical protein
MIQNSVLYQLDSLEELHFLYDAVIPHFALSVCAWLDKHFTGRWIGRGGPAERHPQSLDLILCDFFLAGWAKRKLDKLEQKISDTFATLPRDSLGKNIESVPFTLQKGVSKNEAMLKSENKWPSVGIKMAQG